MIGEQIENYKIVAMLGEGGMGTVYRAVDVNLDRTVALKLLHAGLTSHPELESRFRAEARAQANLNHPNIATLYAFSIWQGKAVMVMEYLEGNTLQQLITQRGAMQPQVAVSLMGQALAGVGAAHRQGIIHRDLKPANLMLNKDGIVKVMDFGIAKVEGGAKLTRTNSTIGTFCYMSPEQILGKPVDARSDIYSMGITLYEMLTGDVPFNFDSDFAIQRAHLETEPPRLALQNPNIPSELEAVVFRALAKQPENRYANAGEFIQALSAIGSVPAHAVTPPPTPDRRTAFDPQLHRPSTPGTPIPAYTPPPATHQFSTPPPPAFTSSPNLQPPAVVPPFAVVPAKPKKNGMVFGIIGAVALLALLAVAWVFAKPKHSDNADADNAAHHETPVVVPSKPTQPHADPLANPNTPVALHTDKPHDTGKVITPSNTVPKPQPVVTTTAAPPPPIKVPEASPAVATSFVGHWVGTYLDSATHQSTQIQLKLKQGTGETLSGSMNYTTPDSVTGECPVSTSAYSAQTQSLTLLIHCPGTDHPTYFNGPTTFSNVSPTATVLSHGKVTYKPTYSVVLAKTPS